MRPDANVIELRNPSRDPHTGRNMRNYGVPANSRIPEANELVATAVRVIGENKADADAVAAKRAEIDQETLDDRAAYAAAVIAGGKAKRPDGKRLAQLRDELAELERKEDGSRLAAATSVEAVKAAVEENSDDWAGRVEELAAGLRADAAGLLEPFLAKFAELLDAENEAKWLRHAGQYNPVKLAARTSIADVSWAQIELELLRFVGSAPPEPKTFAEHVIASGRRPSPDVALVRADGSPIPADEIPEEAA